jgi:trehalose 6-phosphate phosphatase
MIEAREGWMSRLSEVPLIWDRQQEFDERLDARTPAIFLDYDGTLTPIVEDYTKAFLPEAMRTTIAALAREYLVAIVSGRDVTTMRQLVPLDSLFFAGSHGFEISGPKGWHDTLEKGVEALPELDRAEAELREQLRDNAGHAIERKRFSIAIHYRRVAEADVPALEGIVDRIAAEHPSLRKGIGKKVFRLQPDVEWDKGHAVAWLIERLGLDRPDAMPLYIGDDVTDEDAFRVLHGRGIAIVVRGEDDSRETAAQYALADPNDVRRFLEALISRAREEAR